MNVIMRNAMKAAGAVHIALYRSSKGRIGGRVKGLPIMLITVAGRTSGIKRTTPVVCLEDGGTWLVSGSAGGAKDEPQWFRNLRAADVARIEMLGVQTDVGVEVAEGEDRDQRWRQLTSVAPFFDDYQAKVDRVIPIAVLTPLPPS
jgi:deazaflavin-dependent oxidoreductase (nitroreductase family)